MLCVFYYNKKALVHVKCNYELLMSVVWALFNKNKIIGFLKFWMSAFLLFKQLRENMIFVLWF